MLSWKNCYPGMFGISNGWCRKVALVKRVKGVGGQWWIHNRPLVLLHWWEIPIHLSSIEVNPTTWEYLMALLSSLSTFCPLPCFFFFFLFSVLTHSNPGSSPSALMLGIDHWLFLWRGRCLTTRLLVELHLHLLIRNS